MPVMPEAVGTFGLLLGLIPVDAVDVVIGAPFGILPRSAPTKHILPYRLFTALPS